MDKPDDPTRPINTTTSTSTQPIMQRPSRPLNANEEMKRKLMIARKITVVSPQGSLQSSTIQAPLSTTSTVINHNGHLVPQQPPVSTTTQTTSVISSQPSPSKSTKDRLLMVHQARYGLSLPALEKKCLTLPNNPQQQKEITHYLGLRFPQLVIEKGLPHNKFDTNDKINDFLTAFFTTMPILQQCGFITDHTPFSDVLTFALRVNAEVLSPNNMAQQVQHVSRAYRILGLTSLHFNDDSTYNNSVADRQHVYLYIAGLRNEVRNLGEAFTIDDIDIRVPLTDVISELLLKFSKPAHAKFEIMMGESIEAAIKIIDLQHTLRLDRRHLEETFNRKQQQLRNYYENQRQEYLRLAQQARQNNRNQYFYDNWEEERHNRHAAECLAKHNDMSATWDACVRQIDGFTQQHRTDLIYIDYAKLTYSDCLAASFVNNYVFVSNEQIDNMINDMAGLYSIPNRPVDYHRYVKLHGNTFFPHEDRMPNFFIHNYDYRDSVEINARTLEDLIRFKGDGRIAHNVSNNLRLLYQYVTTMNVSTEFLTYRLAEITRSNVVEEIQSRVAALKYETVVYNNLNQPIGHTNNWPERIHLIYTRVPPTLVGQHLGRNQHGDNIIMDLTMAKREVTDHIVGALTGCRDGRNQKISLLESNFRNALSCHDFKIRILKPLAAIISNLKEAHLSAIELRNYSNEGRIETSHAVRQKMRGPLGLLGEYASVDNPGYVRNAQENSPSAIISRMFDPYADRYLGNINRGFFFNAGNNVGNLGPTPVINICSLVNAIYEEFDRSITREQLIEYVSAYGDLIHDQAEHPICASENGVFIRNIENNEARTAKNIYLKTVIVHLLETLEILHFQSDEIKRTLYGWDAQTDAPAKVLNRRTGRMMDLSELIDFY